MGMTVGVPGGGTTFGPGALMQALASRAIRTRTANSDAATSGVLSMGICMSLHETGNNDCFNYENIRSYRGVQGKCPVSCPGEMAVLRPDYLLARASQAALRAHR
jgi:hypothetical protein